MEIYKNWVDDLEKEIKMFKEDHFYGRESFKKEMIKIMAKEYLVGFIGMMEHRYKRALYDIKDKQIKVNYKNILKEIYKLNNQYHEKEGNGISVYNELEAAERNVMTFFNTDLGENRELYYKYINNRYHKNIKSDFEIFVINKNRKIDLLKTEMVIMQYYLRIFLVKGLKELKKETLDNDGYFKEETINKLISNVG